MKRILGHVAAVFVTGLVLSAAIPACATNDQTIFVQGVLAPPVTRTNGACLYTNDPEQAQLFQARMDVGVTDSYVSVMLVGNQLIARGDPNNNRAESNRVHVNGAVVKVTEPDGRVIREFTSYGLGFANPQTNNAADYTTIGVVVFDAPTADIIRPQLPNRAVSKTLLIQIKVFGQTLGGTDVESGEFQLPMQVCNGCLVNFTGANDPEAAVQPNCNVPLDPTSTTNVIPCSAGQDELTPCQACAGRPACNPATP